MTQLDQATTTIGIPFPDLKLASTKQSFQLSDYLGQQKVVLHFICHFSCSRCWRSVIQLEKLYAVLRGFDITVLTIGPGEHLCPATKLARELNIPFPLLMSASDEIRFSPGGVDTHADLHYNATVLLDSNGVVRYGQFTHAPTATLDVNALLSAVVYLGVRREKSKTRLPHPSLAGKEQKKARFHLSMPEPCTC